MSLSRGDCGAMSSGLFWILRRIPGPKGFNNNLVTIMQEVIGIRTSSTVLPLLVLGLLCIGAVAQHWDNDNWARSGWQGSYSWHPYQYSNSYWSPYTNYWYPYTNSYSYHNYYPNYLPYYENGVEMRSGEATAEWLFYHGIGEPWVGGNPPHSQSWD